MKPAHLIAGIATILLLSMLALAQADSTAYIRINTNVDIMEATMHADGPVEIAGTAFAAGFINFTTALNSYLSQQSNVTVLVPITATSRATLSSLSITQRIKDIILNGTLTPLDLSAFFQDPDNDTLAYHASAVDGINVTISNGLVTMRNINATGARQIRFSASDADTTVYSHWVAIYPGATLPVSPNLRGNAVVEPKEDARFTFEFFSDEQLEQHGKSKTRRSLAKEHGSWARTSETVKATMLDSRDLPADTQPLIEELREGKFAITIPPARAFPPGIYTLRVEMLKDGITYVETASFAWGVLAINTDKSIYLPGENSFIGIGVLDDTGRMVCDARVTLAITSPQNVTTTLSTDNNTILISPECPVFGVTELPDYYTNYTVAGTGNYTLNLTAITENGEKSVLDTIVVRSAVSFDIRRSGPTRIFPPVPYNMSFAIATNEAYAGPVTESVPASFTVLPQSGMSNSTANDTQLLTWNVNFQPNQSYSLSYQFDAPDISPYLFLLGPLQIGSFSELRNWQIASDAPGLCTGTVHVCSSHDNDGPACTAAGCSYNSHSGGCSGTHNACSTYDNTDSATCTTHACTWTSTTVNNSIIVPAANANVSGNVFVNVSVNATGGTVSSVNVTFLRPSGNATAWMKMNLSSGTLTAGYWNATISTPLLPDNIYNISVNATVSSVTNISLNVSVVIDNTAPNISMMTPSNGSTLTGSMLINASVNDTLSKVFNVTFRLSSADGSTVTSWVPASLNSGNIDQGYWNATFDTKTVEDATYNITINATDFAGKQQITNISQITTNNNVLSSCKNLNTANKTYALITNISSTSTCFTVSAVNVTLDCNGNAVTYATSSRGYGVNVVGVNGTMVRNCVFVKNNAAVSFSTGVFVNSSNNNVLLNNTVNSLGNYSFGIELRGSNFTNVSGNVVNVTGNFSQAIGLYDSGFVNITANTLRTGLGHDGPGINLTETTSTRIEQNNISTSGTYLNPGIYLVSSSNNNLIASNNINVSGTGGSNYGVYLSGSSSNNVTSNVISTSTTGGNNYGVYLSGSSSNNVTSNVISTSGTDFNPGIYLVSSSNNNLIASNNINVSGTGGSNYGAFLSGSSSNNVTSNVISTSGTDFNYGIYLAVSSSNNVISSNVISANGTGVDNYGAFLSGSSSNNVISSNVISTNGTSNNFGIYLTGSSNNSITANTMRTSGTGGNNYGAYIFISSDNNFSKNVINASGAAGHGIYLFGGSGGNLFYGESVFTAGVGSHGVFLSTGTGNNFTGVNVTTFGNASYGLLLDRPVLTNVTDSVIKAVGNVSFAVQLQHSGAGLPANNTFYNNIFNTTAAAVNVTSPLSVNNFSVQTFSGTNIVGGSLVGGNFYDNSTVGGQSAYSLTCADGNGDGICDVSLQFGSSNNTDFFPLAPPPPSDVCQDINQANKVFNLNASVSSTSTCFTVSAVNVTLDCNGNAVTYATSSRGYGVNIAGVNSTTVKNCVFLQNGAQASSSGIFVNNSNATTISNNTINVSGTSSQGVFIALSDLTSISNNTINTSGASSFGLGFSGATTALVIGNVITVRDTGSTKTSGINLTDVTGSVIAQNDILALGSISNYGIHLKPASNNNITSNRIVASGSSSSNIGFLIDLSSSGNNITDNNISTAGTTINYGIQFANNGAVNNLLSRNVISSEGTSSNSRSYGIYLAGSDNRIYSNNITTVGTGNDHGIISGREANNITNNRVNITSNNSFAVYISGLSDTHNFTDNLLITTGNNSFAVQIESSGPFVPQGHIFSNNVFNTTAAAVNVATPLTVNNFSLTATRSSTNIIGGTLLGGNFYDNSTVGGLDAYSKTCTDSNGDGICDASLQFGSSNNTDLFPLTFAPVLTLTVASYQNASFATPFAFFDNSSVTLSHLAHFKAASNTPLGTINASAFKADDRTINHSFHNWTNSTDSTYNISVNVSGWLAGVYDIELTLANPFDAFATASVQMHVYGGQNVSAYNMSWQQQGTLAVQDYVLENKHTIAVINGTGNATTLLVFMYQKDAQASFNFSGISDGNASGSGELTTGSIKNKTSHYAFRMPQQGEGLGSAGLNMTINVTDPWSIPAYGSGNSMDANTSANVSFNGSQAGGGFKSVAVGDVNGDGIGDVIIGASNASTAVGGAGAGRVFVFYGPKSAGFGSSFDANASANVSFNGSQVSGFFGESVAVGDVNGDGIGDVVIGARQASTAGVGNISGRVFVFYGSNSTGFGSSFDANASANVSFNGSQVSGFFGESVAVGDVNGDGMGDVITGATWASTAVGGNFAGRVYVFYGSNLTGFGSSFDANASANVSFNGSQVSGYLGTSVAVGDVNGDNVGDVVNGANWVTTAGGGIRAGRVYVFYGSNSTGFGSSFDANAHANVTFDGSQASGYLGTSVAVGDVNGDGMGDVVSGAYLASTAGVGNLAGRAYVFYGRNITGFGAGNRFDANASANVSFNGSQVSGLFGISVAVGDVNGDGMGDVVSGAYLASTAGVGAGAGRVYVFYGSNLTGFGSSFDANASANVSFNGSQVSGFFGGSVAVGDVNGDSVGDVVSGAFQASTAGGGENSGRVYAFYSPAEAQSTIAIYSIANLSIGMNSENADYLVLQLYNPDGNLANLTDLWPNIAGRLGSDTRDDVVRKGTGEVGNVALSPDQVWNTTAVGANKAAYYISLYDNESSYDGVKNVTLALVHATNNSIRLLNLSYYNDSVYGAAALRLHYNTSGATTASSLKYYLAFTMCKDGAKCIDEWMPAISAQTSEPDAFGDFGSEPPSLVVSCQALDAANTAYTLGNDVSSTSTCFTISAANVTLNCNGNAVTYATSSQGYGVNIVGVNSTTVQNCVFSQPGSQAASTAILLNNSNHSLVTLNSITVSGSNSFGIDLHRVNFSNISFNRITTLGASGQGIALLLSGNSNITKNNITTQGNGNPRTYGLNITASNNNRVEHNIINTTGTEQNYGVYLLTNANFNLIRFNNISTSGIGNNYGIHPSGSANNLLEGNNITTTGTNDNYGIYLLSSSSHNISNNSITTTGSSSQNYGIFLSSSTSNRLTGNAVRTNGTSNNFGISLSSTSDTNTLTSNIVSSGGTTNSNYGLYLSASSANTIRQQNITTTGTTNNYGLFLQSASASNTLTLVNISTNGSGNNNYGAYLSASSSNNLTGFRITANGTEFNYGFYLENANLNNLTENTVIILTNNSHSIYLLGSNKSLLRDNNLKTTGNLSFGLQLENVGIIDAGNVPTNNSLYNNIFNTTALAVNVTSLLSVNNFSVQTYSGTNIIGGSLIGGNFYDNSTVGGLAAYSLTCADGNGDGICDASLQFGSSNSTDFFPLTPLQPSSCRELNTPGQTYTLVNGVSAASSCFNVTAANVTIDCGGYVVEYAAAMPGYGVHVVGVNSTTVQNCVFVKGSNGIQYSAGVFVNNSNNSIILGNTVNSTGNYSFGIELRGSNFTNVSGNTVNVSGNYSFAVSLLVSGSNNITRNAIRTQGGSNGYGLNLTRSSGNLLVGNNVTTRGTLQNNYGVYVSGGSSNVLVGNNLSTNGTDTNYGVFLSGSIGVNVSGNVVAAAGSGDSNYGVYVSGGSSNVLVGNNLSTSGTSSNYGFFVSGGSSNNVFIGNTITTRGSASSNYGVYLSTGTFSSLDDTLIQSNTVSTNGTSDNYGLYAYLSFLSTLYRLNVTNNTFLTSGSSGNNFGIYFDLDSGAESSVLSDAFVAFNDIVTNGSGSDYGILFSKAGGLAATFLYSNVSGNVIDTVSNASSGIYIINDIDFSNFSDNTVTTQGNLSFGVQLEHDGSDMPENNTFWNNVFNTTARHVNVTSPLAVNNFSVQTFSGVNIVGGLLVGGNFYDNSTVGGQAAYSLTCADGNGDGICDASLQFGSSNNTDFFPLAPPPPSDVCQAINQANKVFNLNASVSSTSTCFTVSAANVTLNCNGNAVTYATSSQGYGVNIVGVNSTTVQNCLFSQHSSRADSSAIFVNLSNGSVIIGNTINVTGTESLGIELLLSRSTNISSNFINTSGQGGNGIGLVSSQAANITGNTILGNAINNQRGYGINLTNSTGIIISRNIILALGSYNDYGIILSGSHNSIITLNNITANGTKNNAVANKNYGIYALSGSTGNTIDNNIIYTDGSTDNYGIYLFRANYTNISSNSIYTSGFPAILDSNSIGIRLDEATFNNVTANYIATGGVASSSTNDAIFIDAGSNNNSIIGNQLYPTGTFSDGIVIGETSSSLNNILSSNFIYSLSNGIVADSSMTIISNFINASGYAVTATGKNDVNISHNVINSTTTSSAAIYLAGSSGRHTVVNNTILLLGSGAYGIEFLSSPSVAANNNTIRANTITASNLSDFRGIFLYSNNFNNITGNNITFHSNDSQGIYLSQSNHSVFTDNVIFVIGNHSHAINFIESVNNTIYNNVFNTTDNPVNVTSVLYYNNLSLSATSSATNIIGGSLVGGNFYDNSTVGGQAAYSLTCADGNGDGICDASLQFGSSNNTDFFPLAVSAPPVDANGTLAATLNNPLSFAVVQNTTFSINGSFSCEGGGDCYQVNLTAYYNVSGLDIAARINVTVGELPFSNASGTVNQSCSFVDANQICSYNLTVNATGLGNYSFTINATSNNSVIPQNGTQVFTVNITLPAAADSIAPNSTIIVPVAFANVSGSFLVNASVNDSGGGVSGVNLTVFNSTGNATGMILMSLGAGTATNGYWNATFDSTVLPDGYYNLSVNATDSSGNINISGNVSVVVDNTAANVTAVVPVNGTTVAGDLLVNASVNDSLSGVFNVTFRLTTADGSVVTAWLYSALGAGTVSEGFWNTTFDTASVADGEHNITVNVTDFAGNQRVVNLSFITIDNAPPNVSIFVPVGGVNVSGSFLINASVNDTLSGANDVNLSLLQPGSVVSGPVAMSLTSGSVLSGYRSVSFDSTSVADGRYNVSVNGTDVAGNVNVSANVSITIDNAAPSVSAVFLNVTPGDVVSAGNLSGVVTVNATVTDAVTGVVGVQFRYENSTHNGSWAAMAQLGATDYFLAAFSTVALAGGGYNITINATDFLPNGNVTQKITGLVVDNVGPNASLVAPVGGNFSGSLLFNASVNDSLSGVRNVSFGYERPGVGVSWLYAVQNPVGFWQFALATGSLTDGAYNITLNVSDFAGVQTTVVNTTQVLVDNVGPNVSVVLPAVLRNFSADFVVNASVNDTTAGVSLVQFRYENSTHNGSWSVMGLLSGDGVSGGYNGTLVVGGLADGRYNLTVNGTDTAGNQNYTGSPGLYGVVAFQIDRTAPQIFNVRPAPGGWIFNPANTLFEMNVTDNTFNFSSGSTTLSYRPTGVPAYTTSAMTCNQLGDGYNCSLAVDLSLTLLEGDVLQYYFNSTDLKGYTGQNGSAASPITATADSGAPNASLQLPVTGSNHSGSLVLNASVNDSVDGIASVQYRIEGPDIRGPWIALSNNTVEFYNATNVTTSLADNFYNISLNATDSAGNQRLNMNSTQIFVDNTRPNVSFTSSALNASVAFALNGTANDTGAGISTLQYRYENSTHNGSWTAMSLLSGTIASGVYGANVAISSLADGIYNFTLNATDTAANQNYTGSPGLFNSVIVQVDITRPAVSAIFVNQTPGDSSSRANLSGVITLNTTVTDLTTGLQSVQFRYENSTHNGSWTAMTQLGTTNYFLAAFNTATLVDGDYNITINATDIVANENSTEMLTGLVVDNTAPNASLVAPAAGNFSGSLLFNASVNDSLSEVQSTAFGYERQGVAVTWFSATQGASGFWNATLSTSTLPDGIYNLSVNGTDFSGNQQVVRNTTQVAFDNSAPNVTIASPAAGSISAANFNLNATVNDTLALATVQYRYENSTHNGSWTAMSLIESTEGKYGAVVNTAVLVDGMYNFTINGTDFAGNQNASQKVQFTVDTTSPVIFNVRPAPNGWIVSLAQTFEVNVTEANFNLTNNVTLGYNRQGLPLLRSGANCTVVTGSAYNCSVAIDLSSIIGEGQVLSYAFNTTDLAGNVGQNGSVGSPLTATVDTVKPNITLFTPAAGNYSGNLLFNASVNDTTSGITAVSFGYERPGSGITWESMSNISREYYNATLVTTSLVDGSYNISLNATDIAGNQNITSNITQIIIDNGGANVSLLALSSGWITASSFLINVSANDTGTGVVNVSYRYVNVSHTGNWIPLTLGTGTTAQGTWNVTALRASFAEGNYTLQINVTDFSGNQNTTVNVTDIGLDADAPKVTIVSPTSFQNQSAAFVLNVSLLEYSFGILNVSYRLENGTVNSSWSPAGLLNTISGAYSNWSVTVPVAGLVDSAYNITINATDNAGNQNATIKVELVIDQSRPTNITITTPAAGYLASNYTIRVSVNDTPAGVFNVSFRLENSSFNSTWTPLVMTPGTSVYNETLLNLTSINGQQLVNGNYTLRVNTTDTAGNQNASVVVANLSLDNIAPVVTISMPVLNSNFSANFVVNATVTDATSDISAVYVRWENVSGNGDLITMTRTSPSDTTKFNATVVVAGFVDGALTLSVNATDNAGNNNATVVQVYVVQTAPNITITAPAASWRNGNFVVNASINSTAAVVNASYRYENGTHNGSWGALTEGADDYWSATFAVAGLADGNYTFKMWANDSAGNQNSAANITFRHVGIDLTLPSVSAINTPTPGGISGSVVINATVTDATSGLSTQLANMTWRYENSTNNGTWVTLTNSVLNDYNATLDTTTLANGDYTLRINATDAAGNQNTTLTVSVTITNGDTTGPTVTFANISNFASGLVTGTTMPVINISTAENSNCKYSLDTAQIFSDMTSIMSGSNNKQHSVTLTGLLDRAQNGYRFYYSCSDLANNSIAGSDLSQVPSVSFGLDTRSLWNVTMGGSGNNKVLADYFTTGWQGQLHLPKTLLRSTALSNTLNVTQVLASMAGNYSIVYYYNSTGVVSYQPGRPVNSFLNFTGDTSGDVYYINVTVASSRIAIN